MDSYDSGNAADVGPLARKLESIGLRAAGVAHEINTPTQFVGDNTRFLKDTFEQLAPALGRVRELLETAIAGGDCEGEAKALWTYVSERTANLPCEKRLRKWRIGKDL